MEELKELDKILHDLELDEYLNDESLPLIRKGRGILQRLEAGQHETVVMCHCIHWARDGHQHILTEHHYHCKHYNPEKDAKDVIKALTDGIEEWASDEDGVHPECWEAYKRAKYTIGEYNFDTTENT